MRETEDDSDHEEDNPRLRMRDAPARDQLPDRGTVHAVFYRSFLQSILDVHEGVSPLSSDGVVTAGLITAQLNKYGRRLPRVSTALRKYHTHCFQSPVPDVSLSEAWNALKAQEVQVWWSQKSGNDIDRQASHHIEVASNERNDDDLFLVTEEIYIDKHDPRHDFKVTFLKQSDLPNIHSQGVLIFSADHWRSLNVRELTYNDYFLACDEQEYTTLLNFVTRLHVISSPSCVSVALDGRLFVADFIAMVHSPTDSRADLPARIVIQSLGDYLKTHQELFRGLQEVSVSGPRGASVLTYLATQAQLRKFMSALERACHDWESPILNIDWAARIRNYTSLESPRICKAALDLCIKACMMRESSAVSESEGVAAAREAFKVCILGNPITSPKHVLYILPSPNKPLVPTNPDEYIICSIRSRIDSEFCGHDLFQRWGDGSHQIGFDCTIRASEAGHMEKLCSEIRRLFNADLIMHKDGPQNSGPVLRTASSILYCLRELNLIKDDNFDQETLSVIGLCETNYRMWPLFTKVWSGRPLIDLHDFLMKPYGQSQSYDQEAEISISKLAVCSITCCAIAILHEAHYWKGRESSVLGAQIFLKNSYLDVPEASMVVNAVLKGLQTADGSLVQAVLGTTKETYASNNLGIGLKAATNRHTLIVSNTPDAINARNTPSCSCVVCVAVATTQFNGTWRMDLIRSDLTETVPSLGLMRQPSEGAAELLAALVVARSLFISQRNSNYVIHNAPQPNTEERYVRLSTFGTLSATVIQADPLPYDSDRRIRGFHQQFNFQNSAPAETQDEVIEAYWNSDDENSVDRVRQAMIIGAQSTNIDMDVFPFFDAGAADWERYSGTTESSNPVRHAKFTWPGWLCEMIVREAHGHVPDGTAHWTAVRAISLAEANKTAPHGNETERCATEGPQPLRTTSARNKSSVLQPHPGYRWPLENTPKLDEIVLLDAQEKARVCVTMENIALLKPQPIFASHIWETPWHPDVTGRQLSEILSWKDSRYIWLDYLCLPQGARTPSEDVRFRSTLGRLSALQSHMVTRTLKGEYDKRDWERRGWTSVEAIVGDVLLHSAKLCSDTFNSTTRWLRYSFDLEFA